jgi:hypothetical protein
MHCREMPSPLRGKYVGFLDDLFVAPHARGQGVVEALYDALRKFARESGGGRLFDGLRRKTIIGDGGFTIGWRRRRDGSLTRWRWSRRSGCEEEFGRKGLSDPLSGLAALGALPSLLFCRVRERLLSG